MKSLKQGFLIDWLIDWLIGWLAGWLAGWLVDWLTYQLIDWLTEWRIDWPTDQLIDWVMHWLTDQLIDQLTNRTVQEQTSPDQDSFDKKLPINESVENACVVFIKGANERNEFFEKINSNVRRTSPDEQGKGLVILGTNWFGVNSIRWQTVGVSLH